MKLSIHLVIGLAVHAGNAMLLQESQAWLNEHAGRAGVAETLEQGLVSLFDRQAPDPRDSIIAGIENRAVVATLAELARSTEHGVQLDDQEVLADDPINVASSQPAKGSSSSAGYDTPIQIDFSDVFSESSAASPATTASASASATATMHDDAALAAIEIANTNRAMGVDDYLLRELAMLVEGMVRAYARRRLRPLLEQFEVLEVEREGEWKLAKFDIPERVSWACLHRCGWEGAEPVRRGNNEFCPKCAGYAYIYADEAAELLYVPPRRPAA